MTPGQLLDEITEVLEEGNISAEAYSLLENVRGKLLHIVTGVKLDYTPLKEFTYHD